MGEKRGMKALELWCKRVTDGYPGVKVENMTTSWRDGLAFCALIHHFRPDLIDFASLKKNNIYGNNELAFRTAERHLGIPALLDAEDMVEYEVPDRLSILTYLSQFYQTFASHPSSPVKRSPDSTDCSLVLSPSVSSPPPKEGRRREPCFTCGLPVFLAQRLLVGGHLYHRTCFRCARCSAQLTQGNWYETQDGAYCCETCPDEEMAGTNEPEPPPLPSPSPPPLSSRLAEPPPLAASRAASLVGLRRMMFENISHTDDEKLPGRGKSDIIVEPNKLQFNTKRPVEFNRKSSHRLSDSKIDKGDTGVATSECDIVTSDSVSHNIESGSDVQCDLDPVSHSSSDSSRPKLVISHYLSKEDGNVINELDEKHEFSSLNLTTDLKIVEAENADVVSVEIVEAENADVVSVHKLDVDSDLEPNSGSSELSIVQAKNDVIINSDEEIEYNKLVESKESIENDILETSSNTISEVIERDENKSIENETEGLLSHSESASLKGPVDEVTENVDEFTSLTNNIEQLVVEAKNEEVTNSKSEEGETVKEVVNNYEKKDVSEPKVPTPSERVIKHKPPTPHSRKVSRALILPKEEKKKPPEDYPEELNPFGDDDDNDEKGKPTSTNPFGSSDEDEEVCNSPTKEANIPKPAVRKVINAPKINLNPFWSGDEEEEDEENITPVPKPRKLRTPKPSPEPSPQPRRLRSATGSLGSSSSIASRKKKPAPLPPNWNTLGTPGSRKSYSAPRPPPAPRTVTPSPPPLPASSPPTSRPVSPLLIEDNQFFSRQRQNSIISDTSSIGTISSYTPHKSMYGQWKRKKGPAPPRPVPVRRTVQPMPLSSVRQELSDIEIKQQGLERQGVKLEQTIRDKFEQEGASLTPYVEEMVLQLFELVNEKNELFRRQAELMYLRRQHNLEEEHAELEYQIRCLMLCPEHNKTDSDKEKEEQLIQRLVEVVERRNEIIDCLEMDRIREKEEDRSVGTQLGIFSAAVGSEVDLRVKTDKKGKKWKKDKRWSKRDVDKETDEAGEKKKSKKKWFTLHHSAKS